MSDVPPANFPLSNPPADSDEQSQAEISSQPSLLRRVARIGIRMVRRGLLLAKTAHHFARGKGGWHRAPFAAVSRGWQLLRKGGISGLVLRFRMFVCRVACSSSFRIPLSNQLMRDQAEHLQDSLERQPRISIVVPVYRIEPRWLDLCIGSVVNQYYRNWELVLVDDCSREPALTELMADWAAREDRIRLVPLEENQNISGATNAGIKNASGEFIGFLDHDDELTPDALTWIIAYLNRHPEARWFYSDEAIISPEGQCLNLHLKPDYSPEFLLSAMYTCHLSVYAADLIREVGGMRLGFEGSQDHDLALRISEKIRRDQVVHVPRVLYLWRAVESSTAADVDCKPNAVIAGRRAVEEALGRRGIRGSVLSSPYCSSMYQIKLQPQRFPAVSIIIPTKNGLSDLTTCLDSLHKKTQYPDYEVIVIDNQSDDPQVLAYLDREQQAGRLRVLRYREPFNHSAMNNLAVASSESEYVVFMNNDVDLISQAWMETLIATAELDPSIAGVGAKLLYPDNAVQHGGILLGICGLAGHAHRFAEDEDPGYLCRANLLNEFSGATAALLLMRKSAFEEVGGFDELLFPTSFNDVDLWLRLQAAGYRCLYNPFVKAYHYESKSRKTPRPMETEYENRLKEKWKTELANDRFYNPNLGLDNELFFNHRPYPIELREFLPGASSQRTKAA